MEVMYQSTRSTGKKVTASQAILKGLADDGGLFVPDAIPQLDVSLDEIAKMNYQETAYQVMKQFFTDFTQEELEKCIERAYDAKFDTKEIAPLVETESIIWNFSMVQRSHLKIWHFPFFHIFLRLLLRRTILQTRS